MKTQNLFRLAFFRMANVSDSYDTNDDYWVFNALFRDNFEQVAETIRAGFKPNNAGIRLTPQATKDLANSVHTRLRQLLGPVFQANYTGMTARAVNEGIIPPNQSKAQETQFQTWFLQTMRSQGTERLFTTNPYLKKLATKILGDWKKETVTFLRQLDQDWSLIAAQLYPSGKPKSGQVKIGRLHCDLSDPHDGGKTVKIIEIKGGPHFVYKPRSLASETKFYELLAHLNSQGLKPTLYRPWTIEKAGYGWMEYCRPITKIEHNLPVTQLAEQFGALCVIWYLVGGADMHYDNLLFTEQGIVIIDCETLFEADMQYLHLDKVPLMQYLEPDAINHTVLGTQAVVCFQSNLNAKKDRIYDMGGVAKFKEFFRQAATNEQSPWYERPLAAQRVSWEDFAATTCRYVQKTLEFFRQQPTDTVIKTMTDTFAGGTPCRILLRGTSGYAALLHNLSKAYDALQKTTTATAYIDSMLDIIPTNHIPSEYLHDHKKSELKQLLNFDIPYFARVLGQNNLRELFGPELPHRDNTDFLSLGHRLAWLQDPSFIKNEVYLMRLALSPWKELKNYTNTGADFHDVQRYYKQAWSFYDHLPSNSESDVWQKLASIAGKLRDEIDGPDEFKNLFQIQKERDSNDLYQPLPLSYSLFSGLAGTLLFLGTYAAATNNAELATLVRQKLAYFMHISANAAYVARHSIGGVDQGSQALLYVFEHLKRLGIIDTYPVELLTALHPDPHAYHSHDLIVGTPGNNLLAHVFASQTSFADITEWDEQLKACMRRLLSNWDTKQDKQRIGIAHGALGVCVAASEQYSVTGDSELRELALKLSSLEAALTETTHQKTNPYGWCNGKSGRALTYYLLGKSFDMPALIAKAKNLTSFENVSPKFVNHTLCCGSLGFIVAHLHVRQDLAQYDNRAYRLKIFNDFYQKPLQLIDDPGSDTAMVPGNLFYGLSGLGMVLLYCLNPDKAPQPWVIS